MNKLTRVTVKPLQKSIYVKPYSMHYTQNGNEKTWDLLAGLDGVSIIIYNVSRNVLVLIKQFRPAVYFGNIPECDRRDSIDTNKYPAELGITLELCAGVDDKRMSLEEIAAEEVLEECGYKVRASDLEKVSSCITGGVQTYFYCEVTDQMKMCQGGGNHNEIIEVVEMTITDIKKYISQDYIPSPPGFLYNICWFLQNKAK